MNTYWETVWSGPDIREYLLDGMSIIYRGKNNRNEREMIIKKEGTVRNGST